MKEANEFYVIDTAFDDRPMFMASLYPESIAKEIAADLNKRNNTVDRFSTKEETVAL